MPSAVFPGPYLVQLMLILIALFDVQLNDACYDFFTNKKSGIYLTSAYMKQCKLSRLLPEEELVLLLRL